MRLWRSLALWGLILAAAILLFEVTDLDLMIQDRLFNIETGSWMVDAGAPMPRLLFYTGAKGVIILFAVGVLFRYLLSFMKSERGRKGTPWLRQRCLMVVLTFIVVPTTIAELKSATNMYCPSQIERYGGDKPYIKLFEPYPSSCIPCSSGRCFPAGHASGGFSLMVLAFFFKNRWHQRAGLVAGLSAGWVMGGYQMMKGEHFMSHTVVTMIAAWMMILCLVAFSKKIHGAQSAVPHIGSSYA